MNLILPRLPDGHLVGVTGCWHIPSDDVPNLAPLEDVAVVEQGESKVFVRAMLGLSRLPTEAGGPGALVHAHIEAKAADSFQQQPEPTTDIATLEESLGCLIGKKDFQAAQYTAEWMIAWKEVPIGSILLPIAASSEKFMTDHRALLVCGKFVIIGDADFLDFSSWGESGRFRYNVQIEAKSFDPIGWDSLARVAVRLTPEFNRLVLAKTSPVASTEDGGCQNG